MSREAAFYPPGFQVPGTVYKVLRLLAQGGMGFVYDVEDVSVGKRYVLKTLTPELLGRRDLARRMEAEARVLARLSHPNVVDVITAGTTQDDQRMPYFVMERLNGQSLRTVLDKKGALDLVLACRIGIDVLDALEHAHDNGVIHRDVKPDNIFLHRTAVGTTVTKLLDFGVMRLVDSNLDDTRGRFVGTLRYAAPEQILAKDVDRAADLYATALVLYELVAGRGPFDEVEEMVQLANAHVNEAPPPLSRFVATPPAFERLVMSALSKDPDGRPRDAFTFAAELRKLLKTAQRSDGATSARTAIEPLSSAGTPAMASGSPPQASSTGASEDPLSALAAVSSGPVQDGLQAYAKTLAGDPSTVREGGAASPNFAATMRISDAPPAPGAGPAPRADVDRRALTKSFVADPLPRSPYGDTLQVAPGAPQPDVMPIVFSEERQAPTTTGALVDEAHATVPGLGRPPQRAGLLAVAFASILGLGAIGGAVWRFGSNHVRAPEVTAAELPAALTGSVLAAPAAAAPAPPVASAAPAPSVAASSLAAVAKPAPPQKPISSGLQKAAGSTQAEKPKEPARKPVDPKPVTKRPGMDF